MKAPTNAERPTPMDGPKRPLKLHEAYHAHVYFDEQTREFATTVCEEASRQFGATMGRVHTTPVGPHPVWSCQLAFSIDAFDALIPWLDAHRGQLTVLVHGLSGDDLKDHTDHAYWLGAPMPLDVSIFGA